MGEKKNCKHGQDEKKLAANGPQKYDSYEQPVPPDGGWGWVVVFASFMIHVVTDGVVYSFGELFKELLNKYKEGAGITSLISSIMVGTTLCSGPIASIFVNKFGCRPVTIAGSIIASSCIVMSMFATNITVLILTLGFGTGIGFGLIYLPAIVSVTCWFEKYRSVATGIGVCGSGFGTILYAPLIKMSISQFGLEGTLAMIAASVSTCVFYGALLKSVPTAESEPEKLKKLSIYSPENVPLTTITPADGDGFNNGRRYSVHDVTDLTLQNDSLHLQAGTQFVSQPTLVVNNARLNKSSLSLMSTYSNIKLMERRDVFFTGSVKSIRDASKSNGYLSGPQKQICSQKSPKKKSYNCFPCSLECQDIISEMTDFSLLKDVIFVLFVVSNFLTSIGFNLPYLYIPIQVDGKEGYSVDSSSYILSTIGFGNTAGRIILGYASDKKSVNRLFLYNTCLTICGIACIVSVFITNMVQHLIYAFLFGFTTGAYVGLTSVITVDLFGLDKLTNAFGLLLLFQGIASFIGPPLAGFVCDRLNSFDYGFYISGVTISISGLMLYSIPPIQRYLDGKKSKSSTVVKC